MTKDPRAVANEVTVKVLITLKHYALDFGGLVAGDKYGKEECVKHLEPIITAALADARRAAQDEAAKDVCMYCAGRAVGYLPARGPNQAGNYVHTCQSTTGEDALCKASAIYSRIRYEAQAGQEEG